MRDFAVFTIVQDEREWLPTWCDYYLRHLDSWDLYVLDHDSVDGSTEGIGGNVVPVHRSETFDHAWLKGTVESFQRFLLQSYRCVLFAEADEIVAPDPRCFAGGLRRYVEEAFLPSQHTAVHCWGKEVYHQRDEPDLDDLRPILSQRRCYGDRAAYNKPLLSKVPLDWTFGFHGATQVVLPSDPPLLLLHLHRADRRRCLRRHRARAGRRFADDGPLGCQHRITEEAEVTAWFDDLDFSLQPVPEDWVRIV